MTDYPAMDIATNIMGLTVPGKLWTVVVYASANRVLRRSFLQHQFYTAGVSRIQIPAISNVQYSRRAGYTGQTLMGKG